MAGVLAIEVEFGGPPAGTPYSNSTCDGSDTGGSGWLAEGGFGFNFEISWFFEVVGIGDEVGFFLSLQGWRGEGEREWQRKQMPSRRRLGLRAEMAERLIGPLATSA